MSVLILMLVVLAYTVGRVVGVGNRHERAFPIWRQRMRDIATSQAFRPIDGRTTLRVVRP
jgi:hypothetical protein